MKAQKYLLKRIQSKISKVNISILFFCILGIINRKTQMEIKSNYDYETNFTREFSSRWNFFRKSTIEQIFYDKKVVNRQAIIVYHSNLFSSKMCQDFGVNQRKGALLNHFRLNISNIVRISLGTFLVLEEGGGRNGRCVFRIYRNLQKIGNFSHVSIVQQGKFKTKN